MGIVNNWLRSDGTHDGVLQRDQGFSRLDLVYRLDLVDKYLLQRIYRAAHHLNEHEIPEDPAEEWVKKWINLL